jgi:hypothetical protein
MTPPTGGASGRDRDIRCDTLGPLARVGGIYGAFRPLAFYLWLISWEGQVSVLKQAATVDGSPKSQ